MAQVQAIFQPLLGGQRHIKNLTNLASEKWLRKLIISSAFSNSAGVLAISASIHPIASSCCAFIGIRNGSTTAQALAALLKLGVELYVVDTATSSRIFHPKLYIATGAMRSRVVVGSANLTYAGLFNNIEAGCEIELDHGNLSDKAYVDTVLAGFEELRVNHPQHCFKITQGRQIVDLIRQGLLEDERLPKTRAALGAASQGATSGKPPINLPISRSKKIVRTRKPRLPTLVPSFGPPSAIPIYGQLVWLKPKLPASDLQLNAGHAPGVLRLTQAGYQVNGAVIDQTIYFRSQVFSALNWM